MSAEISPHQAEARFGISTLYQEMENGERRFRLKCTDGTAYIRTEADASGGWQNSHYHNTVMETYVVQAGWMGFAELLDGRMTVRVVSPGQLVTTRPGVVHNVYLPAQAIIHTVKHGIAHGDDRETDGDAPAFDVATKALSELEVKALAMRAAPTVAYSEDYRHFDLLIWQTPAWSAAIFALSAQSAMEVWKQGAKPQSLHWAGWLMLLLALTLLTFSVVLYRFRSHQRTLKSFTRTPVWKSASSWTQGLISLQAMVLLGLGLVLLGMDTIWAVSVSGVGWSFLVILLERGVRHGRIHAA